MSETDKEATRGNYWQIVRMLAPLEPADLVAMVINAMNDGTMPAGFAHSVLAHAIIHHVLPDHPAWQEVDNVD
jgi:hypothetical protein